MKKQEDRSALRKAYVVVSMEVFTFGHCLSKELHGTQVRTGDTSSWNDTMYKLNNDIFDLTDTEVNLGIYI